MKNIKHTAKRINRAGSTPTYFYRGWVIRNVSGSTWGNGWIYSVVNQPTGQRPRWSSTLNGAKYMIDDSMDN
jgi:hypothetical protein